MSDLRSQLAALPPDKRKLFELLLQQEAERDQPPTPPPPSSAPTVFPLSFAQQRLWFLDQLQPGTPLYNLPVALRLRGPLDLAALRWSFDLIAQRHAILRATFALVDDQPVQRIAASVRVALPLVGLRALPIDMRERAAQGIVNAAARAPFDLATGPLLRTLVLRLAAQEHVLLVTMHHSISDGWSGGVLLRELMALYTAAVAGLPAPLPPLPMQYTDYVVWQREQLQGTALERQLTYWRRTLAGVAVLQLPTDHARPNAATTQTASQPFALTQALTGALKQLSQRAGGTLFMTLLAGFAALLARYSGQDDICVGSFVANRTRAEIEGLIGFFVNNLALRVDLAGEPAVAGLVRRVREVTLGAYDHQDVPFEQVIEALQPERRMSHTPLFQVMCALQNFPLPQPTLTTLRLSPFRTESRHSGLDLTLWLREEGGQIVGELEYRPDLFDQSTILRVVRHLRALLQGMVAAPRGRVLDLPLLSNTERQQLLVEWNDAAADVPQVSFPRLFAAQLAHRPAAIAVVCGAEHLTYDDLHQRAERLSGALSAQGVGPETLVAVFAARGVEFLIAILAVFKAGAAYLPLDPRYPTQRISHMLEQSSAALVLTTHEARAALTPAIAQRPADQRPPILPIMVLGCAAASVRPPRDAGARALAYVIYTSGSTGMPKGAMVEQRGMCNHLHAKIADLQLTAADRIAQTASQCFDISVWQFLAGLVVGGQVHVIEDAIALDPPRLLEQVAHMRISILETVPSLLQALLDEQVDAVARPADLRWLVPTGEALAPELCRCWLHRYPAIPLLNAYGPTECADDVALYPITQPLPPEAITTPIGRAVANMCLYVLGPRLQPVPIGVVGELFIGGVGVGRGYLNRPDLTAERFVPNPFVDCSVQSADCRLGQSTNDERRTTGDDRDSDEHPFALGPASCVRLYRTGDLARCSPSGLITFVGRIDGQVKLRGFRIELGEIEALLARHPAVRQGIVLAREVGPGDTRLVAYVVPADDERRTTNDERADSFFVLHPSSLAPELRAFLSEQLPEYMLPSAFVLLDTLPLTPNGKLDRKALPLPDLTNAERADTFVAPRTPVEQALARVWADVLRLEQVGVEDNFFRLGGHSLLATQVVARMRSTFQVELPLRALFEAPTVAGLALRIASAQRPAQEQMPPPDPRAERVAPLSFAQQRLWFLDQLQPGLPSYNVTVAVELRGALDVAALEWSFNEVVRRHAVLRTHFALVNEQPAQLVAAALAVPLALIDLRDHAAPARRAEVQRCAAAEARHAFNLARGPLLRTSLLQLDEQTHVLLLNVHHIVADGWSMGVLIEELAALYAAAAAGQPAPLPALPMQYADFAIQQREWLEGTDDPHTPAPIQTQLAYWRRQLADLPTLALPTDRQRPAIMTNRGARCRFQVPRALSDALTMLSQAEGVTLFMTLLAIFQVVLARASDQADMVVGTPIAGRTRRETEGLIGFFVNTLVMRTDTGGNPTLHELLRRVRSISLDAFAHQDVPFELLVETLQPTRELNRAPLFQVLFVLQNAPLMLDLPGLRLRMIDIEPESAKFDMSLSVTETPQGLSCVWEYATDLFETPTITRLCAYFQALLVGLVAAPGQRLAELLEAADVGWRAYMQLDFDLADRQLFADDAQANEAQLVLPDAIARVAPLSFAQQRLWFLDQLRPDGPGYAIAAAAHLTGALRVAALQSSLAALIQRHEILRTTFALAQGRPVQLIALANAQRQPALRVLDLSGLSIAMPLAQRLASAAAQRPFDLRAGPLLRATLLRLDSRAHVLLLTLHQIIADGWAIGVFLTELAALYDAFDRQRPAQLPALPVQYADYAITQRALLREEMRAAQLDYWRGALAGAPPLLELPFDRPRPPIQRQHAAQESRLLPAPLSAALAALGEREACTLFETLLAAFVLLLHRYTGQDDIVVGTPIAGRTPELEQLLGRFSNLLALRTRLGDDLSCAGLLGLVRRVSRDAEAHQELRFELVIEALQPTHDFSRAPLFQVLFQVQNAPPSIDLPDLALRLMPLTGETPPLDLALALTETDAGLLATCTYTTDLFDQTTIMRLLGHFQTVSAGIVADPTQRCADLPLLTEAEQAQVHGVWNASAAAYPPEAAVHSLFEAQVARTPDAVAVVYDNASLTYAALNARANQLAHALIARGVGPDMLVALAAERSLAMLVGIFGILKAGGAYVPLDPTYPQERLAFMLDDTQTPVLVTALKDEGRPPPDDGRMQPIVGRRSSFAGHVVDLHADWPTLAGYAATNPPRRVTSDQRAYVIYTSGSTGQPKGVMVLQRGLLNLAYGLRAFFDDPAVATVGLITSISFDISVNQIFPALLFGRALHIIPEDVKFNSAALLRYAHACGLHVLDAVPSYIQAVLRDLAPARLPNAFRSLLIGGEPLDPALVQQIFAQLGPQVAVVNIYGLSEISDVNAFAVLTADARDPAVTIGAPLQNNQLYILNRRWQLQPIGVVGELGIAGASLSRGYLNRPDLTAARFVPNPFVPPEDERRTNDAAARPGVPRPSSFVRLCATGDLGRWRADGRIELLGRMDQQVKVRGFRIEVGEIETLLAQQPGVRACAVLARTDVPGDTRLVAYVVAGKDEGRTTRDEGSDSSFIPRPSSFAQELRTFLAARLPEYMVPSAFVRLDALPMTPNGKLDRRALPAPDLSSAALETAYVAPRTPTEATVAGIWAQVLRRERVGVHDNFFALGGHSLLATQVLYRVRETFQVELTLHTLFAAPTIAQLAQALQQANAEQGALVALQPHGERRPLFCLPPGGGDLLCYAELAQQLGPEQPFYGLRAVGMDGAAAPHTEVSAMAAYYLEALRQVQPRGPYLLAGWSLGGVVAYELAQLLDAQGEQVALLAMIDPSVPPRTPTRQTLDEAALLAGFAQQFGLTPLAELEQQPEAQLRALLAQAQQAGLLPQTLTPAQLRQRLSVFAAHIQALQSYVPQRGRQHITLFQARERMEPEEADPATAWGALAAEITTSIVPGDHYQILRPPYLEVLATQLRACLAALPSRSPAGSAPPHPR